MMAQDRASYNVEFWMVGKLRQSENVDFEAVQMLAEEVKKSRVWNTVIPIEKNTGWVMDGNHRLFVAKLLGIEIVPVVKFDYLIDDFSVLCWHSGLPHCKKALLSTMWSGEILSYKSTRHIFNPDLPAVNIPLDVLMGEQACVEQDVLAVPS